MDEKKECEKWKEEEAEAKVAKNRERANGLAGRKRKRRKEEGKLLERG